MNLQTPFLRKKRLSWFKLYQVKTILVIVVITLLLFVGYKNNFSSLLFSPHQEAQLKSGHAAEVNQDLIFEETFEGKSFFPLRGNSINKIHSMENCDQDWSLATVSQPVFEGEKACRFEIRKDQPLVGSSQRIRSEVTIIKGTEDRRFTPDIWYSFAVLFPSSGMEYSNMRDCINQWYEDGSQETTIRVQQDKAFLEVCPPEGSRTKPRYDLFANKLSGDTAVEKMMLIPKDTWHEFVFHFIHSTDTIGLIEVWRDGIKIHEIHGRNMHLMYPKWKIGLYNARLKETENYSRSIYFDNIRVGKSGAVYSDMVSQEDSESKGKKN